MGEVRVAYAPADKAAARTVVQALQALGFTAAATPLTAARAAAQTPPTVVVWTRKAAAEPRLRALLRGPGAPLLARLDDSPAPACVRGLSFDPNNEHSIRRALGQPLARPRPAPINPPSPSADPPAMQNALATPIMRAKTGAGLAMGAALAVALAVAGVALWQLGYLG